MIKFTYDTIANKEFHDFSRCWRANEIMQISLCILNNRSSTYMQYISLLGFK